MKVGSILYSFRRCPFAIRARLALVYSGVKFELREVKLNDLPEAMLRISPKATVPVLQLSDGTVLEESLGIIEWSLSLNDPDNWLDRNNQTLIYENDEYFKPLLDNYKYADRHLQLSQIEHRANCLPYLNELDQILQTSTCLSGDELGKTDIAIMPFIRQFAGVEPDWFAQCQLGATRNWLNNLIDSALFKRVMAKHPVWQPGDKAVYIL